MSAETIIVKDFDWMETSARIQILKNMPGGYYINISLRGPRQGYRGELCLRPGKATELAAALVAMEVGRDEKGKICPLT